MKSKELILRPLDENDIDLLASWLSKDYILRWYHDADEWLNEINGRHDAYTWIHHFIIMHSKTPIGFCQYYDCYDANDLEDWYSVNKKGETFSIDYLIGDEDYLNKGYGKEIVRILTETIMAIKGAKSIIVQPDNENHASRHVLMANGYVYDEDKKYYYKTL